MSEQHALDVNVERDAAHAKLASSPDRSGIFEKARRAGGGWGLVMVDLASPPRPVPLIDGAVIGTTSRDARVEGAGVAAEHCRVTVRADGCYLEDLDTPGGTFVDGVRARRIPVAHGDVVRLGQQLAVFVERELDSFAGALLEAGGLIHGCRQRADWIDPTLEMAKAGGSVCIQGPPGVGKRTLARLAGAVREAAGDVVVLEGGTDARLPPGGRPMTWVLLDADRLQRTQQLEVTHATARSSGVSIIATTTQPLDRAVADRLIAPPLASMLAKTRINVPSLERRREDIPGIVAHLANRRGIALERISPAVLEGLLRAGWPGGVPQLEAALVAMAEQAGGGALELTHILGSLSRARRPEPSPLQTTDPGLGRARLCDALARADGLIASAARSLGISRQAIYREADRLGLEISGRRGAR